MTAQQYYIALERADIVNTGRSFSKWRVQDSVTKEPLFFRDSKKAAAKELHERVMRMRKANSTDEVVK